MIERGAGISTGLNGYLVGGGYYGKTNELDDIVKKEAEILQGLYGLDVQIRFNSDRESGGAWVIDGKSNCSIGLSASLRNSKLFNMTSEEKSKLSYDDYMELAEDKDIIVIKTSVDYYNTINKFCENDIHYKRAIYKDFLDMESAVNYLKENVSGLKENIGTMFDKPEKS